MNKNQITVVYKTRGDGRHCWQLNRRQRRPSDDWEPTVQAGAGNDPSGDYKGVIRYFARKALI